MHTQFHHLVKYRTPLKQHFFMEIKPYIKTINKTSNTHKLNKLNGDNHR